MHTNTVTWKSKTGDLMNDPDNHIINEIVDDLNFTLDEESNEHLTELELEELMDALDTPGL